MNQSEASEIISLGTTLGGKNRDLWRQIEMDAFGADPHHISQHIPRGKKDGDTEFFILRAGGKPVGRASVDIYEGSMSEEEKTDRMGFIDEFVILSEHKHLSALLIAHCLSVLKGAGAEEVIVKGEGFPALSAQEFDDLAPSDLPSNPPWYIDLFEQEGFVKHKEWANFRFTLPKQVRQRDLERWESLRTSQGIKFKRLNGTSRRDMKQYSAAVHDVMAEHYGYSPVMAMDSYSFVKFLFSGISDRFVRLRMYALHNRSGETIGFLSYHPDYDITRYSLEKYWTMPIYNPKFLMVIPDFVRSLRTAKRARIGSIGFRQEWRRKGLIRYLDFALKEVIKE